VLITGLSPSAGVDIARSFAEQKARLIIQTCAEGPETTAIGALLAESAAEFTLFTAPVASNAEAVCLAQTAARTYGGLDAVINILTVSPADLKRCRSHADIEALVSDMLLPATLIMRVTANRMRLMMGEGSILNVVMCPAPADAAEAALIGIIRATLACLTRGEAKEWASSGIRINAIGPRAPTKEAAGGTVLSSEPDVAAVALHLASRKGKQLSGYVFEAESGANCGL
jgi:3-oxoacyl-[acyl-carrier protein] reductase